MRRVLRAWREAEKVLREHNVKRPPVNVEVLAEKYARIVKRPLDTEISGVLVPSADGTFVILVNAQHPVVRQRFTVAHELGHLLLHGYTTPHADRSFKFRDSRATEGGAIEEIQANQFAAELLMPRELILEAAETRSFGHVAETPEDEKEFDAWVAQLAYRFKVSKQAISIRLSSLLA